MLTENSSEVGGLENFEVRLIDTVHSYSLSHLPTRSEETATAAAVSALFVVPLGSLSLSRKPRFGRAQMAASGVCGSIRREFQRDRSEGHGVDIVLIIVGTGTLPRDRTPAARALSRLIRPEFQLMQEGEAGILPSIGVGCAIVAIPITGCLRSQEAH